MPNLNEKVSDIVENAEVYHQAFYDAEVFTGPSLFFHLRSLETRRSEDFILHLEFIYATLASWGMHRMGEGGAKMQNFHVFRRSVEPLRKDILEAGNIDYRLMSEFHWLLLEKIFRSIKIMASGTSLVGNSKVMAHLIPNVIPPIDRQYTLKYLMGNSTIENDLNYEWNLLKGLVGDFFLPVATDNRFLMLAEKWMSDQVTYPWDTSILKVVDNLLIGAKRRSVEKSVKGKPEGGPQTLPVEKENIGRQGSGFYVYENWTAEQKAVIHIGHCGYCNEGKGCHENPLENRNGRWHGPFNNLEEAKEEAKRTGRSVRNHNCCWQK